MSAGMLTRRIVTYTTSGLLACGAITGISFLPFYFSSPSSSGFGKATNPRFVMVNTNGSNSELSFSYESFFRGGQKVNKPIPFAETNINFDGYKLKEGDILCSPKQNGKFYVLEEISGRKAAFSTYKIKGYDGEHVINLCNLHRFPKHVIEDESKTIELQGLNNWNRRNSYSAGTDTVYISSCFFNLKEPQKLNTNSKWGISWEKCKLKEYGNDWWNIVPTTELSADYNIE